MYVKHVVQLVAGKYGTSSFGLELSAFLASR